MGDNFKKVQTGQPLKIPAETFNAFLDAARDFRARQQSRESQSEPSFRQSGIVKVKNGSGEDRNRFELLGIDRPIFTPTDNLDTFQNDVLLVGVMPDGEEHPGRFCVLLEPLKADAIGLAVVNGVCPVRMDVQEESDTFAEVQDDDATQLKSGGSGSVTILWKESGTGENKWAVVRLGDSQPVIRKAEMIDTLRQGDTDPAKAWLLKYEDDEWQRTDNKIDLYGDQGFRGVAFGKTDDVDSGDKIDVYYSHEAKQWYGVVGGWYFHGDVVDDIAEGDQGEVKLNVGAGSDAREITVPAFSPYAAVKKDDFVSVNWNTFSVHWDIGKFQGAEPGCGLARDEDPESSDYGKLKVKASDLAGCGLDVDGDCGLKVKNTDLVGPGLVPVGDCQLGVQIVAGCGIEVTDGTEVSVKATDLAQSGLKTEGECGLAVNPGCGIWINGGKVEVAHDELAGDGLVIGDNCEIDVDCNWIKTECVKPGCGIWWNGDLLEVAHDELAGDGLVIGDNCELDVDCNWIKTECVKPGCGLWWNGDQLEVAHDELAGNGLVIGSNCAIDVDCDWIKTNCINCQTIRDCITPGCGIWWNGDQLEVAHDELAGHGLTVGINCQLDVDCDWIKTECVKPGCGLWWNGDQLEVAHDELAGNGLVIGNNCAIDVDCDWIKTQCVKPGCGLWWNGDQLEVAHDELAGNGLAIGNGCALDVDWSQIPVDCGVWWNGSALAVAHDELVGKGLVIGSNCALDVSIGCGLRFSSGDAVEVNPAELAGNGLTAGSGCALNVDWSQIPVGCGVWWNGTALAVAHDELAGRGLVIGNDCALDVSLGCGLRFGTGDSIEVNPANIAGNGLMVGSGCAVNVDWSQIPVGCGIWWNGSALEVAHDELAGDGLKIGNNCQLDVDCDWIKSQCIDCDTIQNCITPGCGLWWNGNQLEVAHDELAGNGLKVGSNCQLEIDCDYIQANCIDCNTVRDCITPGCGLWWDGTQLAVAHDELAGNGLTPGSGCALDVEWSQVPVGCGLWWNGAELAVAHDELAGNGLTIGSNCQLEIDTSPASGYTFSAVTNVDLSLSGCTLTLTRTVTAFELKTNSAGVVIGFAQISSQTLESTASLCDCECLSDSIPGQPMALLTIPDGEWNDMLANGGEVAWPIA